LTALILAIDIKHEFLFALDEVDHTLRADGDTQGDDDISYKLDYPVRSLLVFMGIFDELNHSQDYIS